MRIMRAGENCSERFSSRKPAKASFLLEKEQNVG